MKAVLIGNYGVGNFGDEALREYFVHTFTEVEWTVIAQRHGPSAIVRLPFGLRSLFLTPWWKTVRAIRAADVVVFGGGTLFADGESIRACLIWGFHVLVIRVLGTPYFLSFQGVGPFHGRFAAWLSRWAFRGASFVSIRDAASFERIRTWNLPCAPVETCDPVFLGFSRSARPRHPKGTVVLIPRDNSGQPFRDAARALLDGMASVGRIDIASFKPNDPRERAVLDALVEDHPAARVHEIRDTRDLMEMLSTAEHCVTERFHGALAAAAAGIPTTVVSRDAGDKLDESRRLFDTAVAEEAKRLVLVGEAALRTALHG